MKPKTDVFYVRGENGALTPILAEFFEIHGVLCFVHPTPAYLERGNEKTWCATEASTCSNISAYGQTPEHAMLMAIDRIEAQGGKDALLEAVRSRRELHPEECEMLASLYARRKDQPAAPEPRPCPYPDGP